MTPGPTNDVLVKTKWICTRGMRSFWIHILWPILLWRRLMRTQTLKNYGMRFYGTILNTCVNPHCSLDTSDKNLFSCVNLPEDIRLFGKSNFYLGLKFSIWNNFISVSIAASSGWAEKFHINRPFKSCLWLKHILTIISYDVPFIRPPLKMSCQYWRMARKSET